MKKIELESMVFSKAIPVLKDIYGAFMKDPTQTDRPDAAIFLEKDPAIRIGVEITTITSSKKLSYLNDKRYGKENGQAIVETLFGAGDVGDSRAHKQFSESKKNNYVFAALRAKRDKYHSYKKQGFSEVILLIYEDHFDKVLSQYHRDWTDYFLSIYDYPYEKVIYVGKESCLVYDREKKRSKRPHRDHTKELGEITMQFITPDGQFYNYHETLTKEPIIKLKK